MAEALRLAINSSADILVAREKGRELAAALGFSATDLTFIATAISSLARNIVHFAKQGEMQMAEANEGGRRGIVIVASDHGPGMPADLEISVDHTPIPGAGLGLRGVKLFMDELEINSTPGKGTLVMARKWLPVTAATSTRHGG